MAKRGPKHWEHNPRRLQPLPLIARKLGVSVRTVQSDLHRALRKLRAQDRSITLDWVHAVAIEDRDLVQAGSVECDRSFIEMYGERG